MFSTIYDFFYTHIFNDNVVFLGDISFDINGDTFYLGPYLSGICSIISMIIILVLCCLFVYKIIKLIGGLITR